ncbi:unnamed protein product [Orchesella dallaii]|uniref:Uncharacterized protein n=1 Tax=Orchesella dallaii TaxID=48710 RepID=A0ABP1RDQ0_9HEXA
MASSTNNSKSKTILPFETTSPVGEGDRPEDDKAKTRAKIFAEVPDPTLTDLKDSKIINLTATIGNDLFVAKTKEAKDGRNLTQNQ